VISSLAAIPSSATKATHETVAKNLSETLRLRVLWDFFAINTSMIAKADFKDTYIPRAQALNSSKSPTYLVE